MKRTFVSISMCAALLTACSSAPKVPDAVFALRNEASRLSGLGAKAARDGVATEAASYYAEAYRIYTSVADDEGRVAALDGLAGVYLRSVVPAESSTAAAQPAAAQPAAKIIDPWGTAPTNAAACVALAKSVAADSGKSDLIALAAISEAEAALRANAEAGFRRAAELALAAAASLTGKPADRARALRALAEARKNLSDTKAALEALEEAAEADKRLKRFVEYASDRYLAASIHSKLGAFPAARTALLDALEADRRAEHSAGIGSDYRALGIVSEKTGDKGAAAKYFAQARDVFAAARFSAEAADAEKRRAALE